MEIGENDSLLSELLGKNVSTETKEKSADVNEIANGNEANSTESIFNEEVSKESLLYGLISNESAPQNTNDYKSQYEEKVKSGEWTEVEDAENIEWSAESFKLIEDAQEKPTNSDKDKSNDDPIASTENISEDVDFRKRRIKALNETDFSKIENAKELYELYRIQQEGEDNLASINKQIDALSEEEVIQYAKTISAKIVKEDEAFIKAEKDRVKAEAKAQEDNWNKYAESVVEAGSKFKIPADKSKEKLEKIKNKEFDRQLWSLIADPEKFHKVFDFIMDMEKYEEKIKTKASSKLVVEAITKKNINTDIRTPNLGKINIPI